MTQKQPHVNGQSSQFNSTNGTTRTAEQQAKLDEFNRRLEQEYQKRQNDERDLMDQMIDPDGGVRVTPEDLIPTHRAKAFAYKNGTYKQTESTHPTIVNTGEMPELPESARLDPSLAVGACQWLDEYVEFSKKWSPRGWTDLHVTAGLWVLSTVAARRVALHFGGERFTNLYFMLLADSSVWAKSSTSKIGQKVLQDANLKYLLSPSEATPQAFIKKMSNRKERMKESQITEELKKDLAFAGQQGWYYEEFGQKIQGMMKDNGVMSDYRGLLRRLDDGGDEYEYVTIARGKEKISNPYLSFIGNTTPADLRKFGGAGGALWTDGFWARFAIVAPDNDAKRSKARFPDGEMIIPHSLITQLLEWHNRLGLPEIIVEPIEDEDDDSEKDDKKKKEQEVFVYKGAHPKNFCTMDAGVVDAFYTYGDALMDLAEDQSFDDIRGNYTRFPEKAMRIAMMIASLENNGRITIKHWAKGQEISEMWRKGLHNAYAKLTANVETTVERTQEEAILRVLTKWGPQTARQISQRVKGLGSELIASLLSAMVKGESVVEIKSNRTSVYCINDEV